MLRPLQPGFRLEDLYNGTEWFGDEWEVTIADVATGEEWLVGRQLLTNAQGNGLRVLR